MKKYLLLSVFLGAYMVVSAQSNTFPTSGNVGIGITDPNQSLVVDGFIKAQGSDGRLMLENPAVTNAVYFRNNGTVSERLLEILFGSTVRMVMKENGNLGVGTTNPVTRLQVDGGSISLGLNGGTLMPSLSREPGQGGLNITRINSDGSFNSNLMMIKGGGSVGIGITDPQDKLHVNGALRLNQGEGFRLYGDTNYFGTNLDGIVFSMEDFNASNGSTDGGFVFQGYTPTDSTAKEWMVIKTGGKVGIGTATPGYKLEVNGSSGSPSIMLGNENSIGFKRSDGLPVYGIGHFQGEFTIGRIPNLGSNAGTAVNIATGGSFIKFSHAGLEKMRLTPGGNLGIGNTNPLQPLAINRSIGTVYSTTDVAENGGTSDIMALYNTSSSAGNLYTSLYFKNQGNSGNAAGRMILVNETGGDGSFAFHLRDSDHTGETKEKMRLTSEGYLGIGTDTPATALDVNGIISATTEIRAKSINPGLLLHETDVTNHNWHMQVNSGNFKIFKVDDARTNWEEMMRIEPGGDVAIGTGNATGKLEVKGSSAVYSDFAGYNGETLNAYLPNGKEPTVVISENTGGTLIPATAGQITYKGGLSFGRGGSGIYSVNPNPAGSPYYGDIRFHTTYWNGSNYNNKDRLVIEQGGHVGIGTSDPKNPLTVQGVVNVEGNGDYYGAWFGGEKRTENPSVNLGVWHNNKGSIYWDSTDRRLVFNTQNNSTDIYNNTLVLEQGNVGIGIEAPDTPLTLKSNSTSSGNSGFTLIANQSNDAIVRIAEKSGNSGRLHMYEGGVEKIALYTDGTDSHISAGNLGIGTATVPTGFKLGVDGKIVTKEVKVTLSGWADFVFNQDYKLPTLEEVEAHIKQNGHLPSIPSAIDIEKAGGFELGNMNKKLLQKIEELTLYTIQQEKEIKELKIQETRLKKLEKENAALKSLLERVAKIEEKLSKQ